MTYCCYNIQKAKELIIKVGNILNWSSDLGVGDGILGGMTLGIWSTVRAAKNVDQAESQMRKAYSVLIDAENAINACSCVTMSKYNELVDKHNNLANSSVDKDGAQRLLKEYEDKYNRLIDKFNNLAENSVTKESAERIESEYKRVFAERNDLVTKYNVLVEKAKNLTDKHNDLVDRFNDLDIKHQELREEHDESKEELHGEKLKYAKNIGDEKLKHSGEKSQLQIENTKLREKLESSNAKALDLTKRLTSSESENSRLLIKLDEKSNQLITLRLESGDKDSRLREKESELRRKEEEVEELKSKLGTTQKTAFDEKIQFKEEKLEFLAEQLGIELRRIQTLRRRFKELIIAQENKNSASVNTAQDNITAIKEDLQENGISISDVQRVCKKCKKIAQLELQLEKPQSTSSKSDSKKDWKNINSNFTPELAKEWQNYGFNYQQCQDWINTSPALQRDRAIEEPAYYAWLRDVKKVDVEWLVNYGNERALSLEFICWQQNQYQAQQEQPTNNF